jgi:exodeoxyribonuclease-5
MTNIQLSPTQLKAKEKILYWFNNNTDSSPIFRVFGYAGTGKTTVIKQVVEELGCNPFEVLFAAFTGKAALVMTRHGTPASTIHSLIYTPIIPKKEDYEELKRQLELTTDQQEIKEIYAALREAQQLKFELSNTSPLNKAKLLVLDECMMINEEMLGDILQFNVPILVLGDPGQLPPIKGTGALLSSRPDVMFTEIHRQALDNPIINMSFRARNGKPISVDQYGDSCHIPVRNLTKEHAQGLDQILVGKNTTRRNWNKRMRTILNLEGTYPVPGDKVICLRNKRSLGLFNGLLATVVRVIEEHEAYIQMEILTEMDRTIIVCMLRAHFQEYQVPGTLKELKWWDFQKAEEFDFGYAITVHKAQGSQWDHVGFYDDKFLTWNKPDRCKWLYTGITRAAEVITLMS